MQKGQKNDFENRMAHADAGSVNSDLSKRILMFRSNPSVVWWENVVAVYVRRTNIINMLLAWIIMYVNNNVNN